MLLFPVSSTTGFQSRKVKDVFGTNARSDQMNSLTAPTYMIYERLMNSLVE